MKIGFIYSGFRLSKGNGIVSQALTWKRILEEEGHEVVMCHPWEFNDYSTFDVLQIFSFDNSTESLVNELSKKNKNIFIAPILDPDYSLFNCKLRSYCAIPKLRLANRFSSLRRVRNRVKGILVRSNFEKDYIVKSFGYKAEQCHIVMLSSGVKTTTDFNLNSRERFCFHMSFVTDERKNVKRLIDASVKYNFQLVIAGGIHFEHERSAFESWIKGKSNVKYLGYISEEKKIELYRTAKVFALPSLNEGVGLVALEAAAYGCDIVITSVGGPKEYYNGLAKTVDPYNIDEIGVGVREFLDGQTYQPNLSKMITTQLSDKTVAEKLLRIYTK